MRLIDADAVCERCRASGAICTGEDCEIPSMPTLTPPNEPEYREYTCPNCHHTWLEDRDASDYPEYCPGCGDPLHKEENEPLTLEHLRASPHGKIKDSTLQSICNRANEIACRPPEGEANG